MVVEHMGPTPAERQPAPPDLHPSLTVGAIPSPAIPMGQVAMTVLSLQEAVERTGTSKVDIWRAIQAGALSAKKTDDGGFEIDPADLFAVFETKQADQRPMADDAAASVEASESPETTPEIARNERHRRRVHGAWDGAQGPSRAPSQGASERRTASETDERPAVDLAEQNAQAAEPATERAKVEKMVSYSVLAET